MLLNPNTSIMDFLRAVSRCSDGVYFDSKYGDHLNLKSTLSQYIFSMIESEPQILSAGKITCENPDDQILLEKYILEG